MINIWENSRQALLSHNADSLKPCSSKACHLVSKLLFLKLAPRRGCAFCPPVQDPSSRPRHFPPFAVWTEPELKAHVG